MRTILTVVSRTFGLARAACLSLALFAVTLSAGDAFARVAVRVDVSRQVMTVAVDGAHYGTWRVSTARRGFVTPAGNYRPYLLRRMHYSSIYNNAPMPYSIFFYHGYAIHGTNETGRIGQPASAGCVRLAPGNARALYSLVQRYGMNNSTITIVP